MGKPTPSAGYDGRFRAGGGGALSGTLLAFSARSEWLPSLRASRCCEDALPPSAALVPPALLLLPLPPCAPREDLSARADSLLDWRACHWA